MAQPQTTTTTLTTTQTIQCAGVLKTSNTLASCSTGFYPVYGLISGEQTTALITAFAVCIALMMVFKIILKLLEI